VLILLDKKMNMKLLSMKQKFEYLIRTARVQARKAKLKKANIKEAIAEARKRKSF
jgi:hypothetical protein